MPIRRLLPSLAVFTCQGLGYIDSGSETYALTRTSNDQPRKLTDVLASIRRHAEEAGLDDGFADDVEDGMRLHRMEQRPIHGHNRRYQRGNQSRTERRHCIRFPKRNVVDGRSETGCPVCNRLYGVGSWPLSRRFRASARATAISPWLLLLHQQRSSLAPDPRPKRDRVLTDPDEPGSWLAPARLVLFRASSIGRRMRRPDSQQHHKRGCPNPQAKSDLRPA